jgi:hypothetical protein
MTAARAVMPVAPLPLLRASVRRIVITRSSDLARFVDGLACGRQSAQLRVVLLLEVAYRACVAAATLTAVNHLPAGEMTHVSERQEAARALLAVGSRFRVRCSGCGARYIEAAGTSRARHPVTCRIGACAPATGWDIDIPADNTPTRGGQHA